MSRFGSFWWIGIVVALAVALLPGCGGSAETTATSGDDQQATEETAATDDEAGDEDPYATGIHHVIIDVEGYGQIEVEVNANAAPITVSNFCHLVEDGFYDGLTFHRIMDGFMIQGGDPRGNGTGGSDEKIKGEFKQNGVD
ncbi:MAG: peptidylprolyl isomerase, partial [Atopobiaceae bacterium]|nr:peptidylprolyl isomerase [Atopobiaceae bacterium]